jgi:uncharacterized membrane protein
MYVPLHILTMHILPGLLVAVVSALCVYIGLWLRQRLT